MYSARDRAPTPQALEDPFYYLVNFQQVLDWIVMRYGDLLSAPEQAFVDSFKKMPQGAQALLVRMVMRKGTLFRAGKLVYDEIGSPRDAVCPLVAHGWVDAAPELSLDQLFDVLTKTEITTVFKPFIDRPGTRKGEILDALRPLFPKPRPFQDWCEGHPDRVFSLLTGLSTESATGRSTELATTSFIMETCDRFRLMFFGNLRQDWSEFVLADLGLYRYETVEFSLASRAFQTRRDVDEYLHLYRCRERFENCLTTHAGDIPGSGEATADTLTDTLANVLADLPRKAGGNPWIEARRAKLLFQVAYYCERRGELWSALELYSGCTHPDARVRRIRVLERSGDVQSAWDLAEAAGLAPESEAERQHLLRILPRLRRKLGLARVPGPVSAPVERIDLRLPLPSGICSVEHEVRTHLSQADAPVWYVENTLINGLFGLLCWDAIFAAVSGAFFHRFHSGPVDLLRPDFYQRRADLFDACLEQLESADYRETIQRRYRAKHGLQSPFVHWEGLSRPLLEQALDCFPSAHLKAWFKRLLEDIKANRAGLPDLIQFWPGEKRYQMIEVKGPGDRLQDNQLRWLDFCARHGMPVKVCYVRWTTDGNPSFGPQQDGEQGREQDKEPDGAP